MNRRRNSSLRPLGFAEVIRGGGLILWNLSEPYAGAATVHFINALTFESEPESCVLTDILVEVGAAGLADRVHDGLNIQILIMFGEPRSDELKGLGWLSA